MRVRPNPPHGGNAYYKGTLASTMLTHTSTSSVRRFDNTLRQRFDRLSVTAQRGQLQPSPCGYGLAKQCGQHKSLCYTLSQEYTLPA